LKAELIDAALGKLVFDFIIEILRGKFTIEAS